jgi:hypothetical protein
MIRFSTLRAGWISLVLVGASGIACRKAGTQASIPLPAAAEAAPRSEPRPSRPAETESSEYPWTRAEKSAVEEFLRLHSDLRIARDSDHQESRDGDGDVRRLYGVYHPYFLRGDIDDDGVQDFVLAFVRRDSSSHTPWFSIVVFTGKEGSGGTSFSPGVFLERDVSLARGDLSIDRDAVLITPDLADEGVRRYRWDPLRRSYVFVRDDSDEDETPVPSRT